MSFEPKCSWDICFANCEGKCTILNEVQHPCSFFKTENQHRESVAAAARHCLSSPEGRRYYLKYYAKNKTSTDSEVSEK